ncbi:hypothetical protein ACNKHP_06875 [Shigella boydii]
MLVLPESGGAWLKTCYDAQNDAMLDDEFRVCKKPYEIPSGLRRPRNMMVRGEGHDIWLSTALEQ